MMQKQTNSIVARQRWSALVLASAVATVALPSAAWAQSRTFVGGTDYNTAANWSPADVPDTTAETAIINAGGAFAVTLNTSGLAVGGLTIGSDDSLTIGNNVGYTVAGPISNAGNLLIGSTGTYSDLFLGGASLSGGGTLTLQNYARIRGSGTFTNNSTVQGETDAGGSLGNNEVAITNGVTGIIQANVSGKVLTVDPVAGTNTFINAGTLRATNGGTLSLTGSGTGSFNNAGGTIQAQANSFVSLNNSVSITGGTLSTVGTGEIRTSNASITGVTLAGTLRVANNTGLTISGTIANSGTIFVDSTGTFADVFVDSVNNATLSSGGTVTLANYARVRGGGTLTNNGTINGETNPGGSLGANEISIANTGLIDANVSTKTLHVDPAAAGSVINTGTMRATNGGVLQLNGNGGGGFTNTGGTIQAQAGSTVQLNNSASVTGGSLGSIGTGIVELDAGTTLTGLTLSGTVNIPNSQNATFSGTIANSSAITVNSVGSFTDLYLGGATLTGSGSITLKNASRVRGGGTFVNNNTINGETSNSGSLGSNETTIINNALVNANDAGGLTLVVDPAGAAAGTSTFTNNSTLRASGGGRLQLTGNGGGDFDNTSGTIEALAGSIVRIDNGAVVKGGTINGTGTGVVEVSNATFTNATFGGTVTQLNSSSVTFTGTNNGAYTVNSTGSFTDLYAGGSTIGSAGVVTLKNAARIRGGGTLTNNGTIAGETNNGGSLGANELTVINTGLVNANDATGLALVIDPAGAAAGVTTFTNTGTLRASAGGTLYLTGNGGGDFTNTGGTIQALAGSQVQLTNGVAITGGTLTSTGTGNIRLNSGTSATLIGLTNAGTFVAGNASTLTLSGTINNTGSININSTGSFTDLYTDGTSTTLTGGGTLILSGADRIRGGGTFTNVNNTIQGETNGGSSIGNNDTKIVNSSLINANVSTLALVIDPGTAGFINNGGTAQASGGGILYLTGNGGGDFTNTGGTIQALAGSQVQLANNPNIIGGTISSTGTGTVQLNSGNAATLDGLTNASTFTAINSSSLTLANTITNNGTMLIGSTGSFTDLYVNGATLSGTGTLTLQNADRVRGGGTFTNNSIIQGETTNGGSFGNNDTTVVNNGLINANANGLALDLDPAGAAGTTFTNSATGTVRASGGGVLRLNGNGGGDFTNNGTFEALNGSTFTFVNSAVVTNNSGGSLTGGIYRSIATGIGGSSTLNLPGGNISVNAADVTISGTGSVFSQIDTITQTTSAGKFRVLDGRNFTTVGNYTNTGITQLGGGTFTATGPFNNLTTGETYGYGSITNRIVNSGLIRASGGVLSVGGIDPATTAGTARVDAGATLTLSVATADSTVNVLDNNGNLNVGGFNLLVRSDYTNGNFGTGNSFNPRANVTGGQIQASPGVAQTITGATNGTTATPTIALGNIRTGTSVSVPFSVNNVGASGPSLRGAIQTTNAAGFGGNITDARLAGTGTVAGNFGPIAAGASTSPYTVIFNGTAAGALTGQKIAVVNNFDNVVDQQISVTGAAYNPAVASVTPNPVFVGNFHVGDTVAGSTITFANTAAAGAFSEDLGVSGVAASGTAALGAGSPTSFNVLAGSNNTAVKAAVSTTTAGAKSGTITASLTSTGQVNGVAIPGLSPLGLTGASVAVTGNVYRLATATVPTPINLGDKHVGASGVTAITVNNTAVNDGFSESLQATAGAITGDVAAASGSATVAPTASSTALSATINTATSGAKNGTVAVGLTSVAVSGTGLSNTPLTGQTVTVTSNVYNLAAPQVTNSPIGYGIVHVGDVVTPIGVAIKNNAPATFSEKLNAAGGAAPVGFTGGGSVTGLTAQSTNNTGIAYGISTATAAILNANIPISFVSDGAGINSLGTTNLTAGSVTVTAQVNNYAKPTLSKSSGAGTFGGSGATYTLNFGTVNQFTTNPTALLGLLNDTTGPADTLAGGWTVVASNFITSGFSPFTGVVAGTSLAGLSVALDTTTVGSFTGTITLAPRSQNTGGYNGALSNVTLSLSGIVDVPEPTVASLLIAGGALLGRRTRRAK